MSPDPIGRWSRVVRMGEEVGRLRASGRQLIGVLCLLLAVSASADLTAPQEQAMLGGHNEIRSDVARGLVGNEPPATNMVKLDWDDDLSGVAQNWVDQCVWNHNADRTAQYAARVGGNT